MHGLKERIKSLDWVQIALPLFVSPIALVAWMGVGYSTIYHPGPGVVFIGVLLALGAGQTIGSFIGLEFLGSAIAIPLFLFSVVALFLFLTWNLTSKRPKKTIPLRLPITMGILNLLSIWLFAGGWNVGLQYEGFNTVIGLGIENLLVVGAFWITWVLVRNKATYNNTITLSLILLVWLLWCAFPTLGIIDL